ISIICYSFCMSNPRKNPQNALLRLLARKKAMSIAELTSQAQEKLLNASTDADCVDVDAKKPKYAVSRAMKQIIDSGLAETLQSDAQEYARLTPAGRKKLASIELSEGSLPLPATWDGR